MFIPNPSVISSSKESTSLKKVKIMYDDLEKIIADERQIADKVKSAGEWLTQKFKNCRVMPLIISVLKGSVLFFADLVRAIKIPVEFDFITISSYGNSTQSSKEPQVTMDSNIDVKGRDIIVVEDIVDTGHTLVKMRDLLLERGAKSFTLLSLFDKPSRRIAQIKPDYSCFEIGDEFIIGYGLDYAQKYRNLPVVGVLKREIYEK